MTDANEIPLDDVTPMGGTPTPSYGVMQPKEMDSLLAGANRLGQRGDESGAEQLLQEGMAKAPMPPKQPAKEIPIGAVTPFKNDFSNVESGSMTKGPSYLGQANKALENLGVDLRDIPIGPFPNSRNFVNMGKDVANVGGEIYSYVKNFGPEHETVEPGPVKPEEAKAAKIMGIPEHNIGEGGFFGKINPQTGELEAHHPPILKMSPTEVQDLNDRTLKQLGMDPAAERQRAEDFSNNPLRSNVDPVANITVKNSIGSWIQDQLNPRMAASKQYAAIQQTVAAQKILRTPLMHSEEEVAAAQSLMDYYKNTVGKGVVENTKDLLEEIKENPGSTLAKIAATLEADPELLGLGKLRLGTLLTEAKLATLTADLTRAQKTAELARRVQGIDQTGMEELAIERARVIAREDRKAEVLSKEIKDTTKKQILGNMASEPVIGGLANVALDQEAQTKEKGYVTKGSEITPLVQGALLGAVAAGGEGLRLIPKKGEIPLDKVTPVTPRKPMEGVENVTTGETPTPQTPTKVETPADREALMKGIWGDERVAKGQAMRDRLKAAAQTGKQLAVPAAVAAGGAALGAALSPEDREGGAKEGLFLPLLTRILSHGDSPLHTPIMREERLAGRITGSPEAQALNTKLNDLVSQGVSPKDIWAKHGFYQDAQDNWHREISDKDITFKGPKFPSGIAKPGLHTPGTIIPLSQFIDHPEFAKLYPVLWKDLRVKFEDNIPSTDASFDPATNTIHVHPNIAKDVLAHEIQHAVQEYEGLPKGTSPTAVFNDLKLERGTAEANFKMVQDAMNQYKKLGREAPVDLQERYRKAFEKMEQYPKTDSGLHDLAFQKYRNSIGEVQASATEGRVQLTPEMRRKMYPGEQMPSLESQWDSSTPGRVMGHELPESNKLPKEDEHIRLAAAGNQRSIGALYNHYMPALTRTMDRFMRQAGPRLGLGGEDIAQRAFFKAIKSLPDFKGGSSFYTYLYSIGKNEAFNAIKETKQESFTPTESMFKKTGAGGRGKTGELSGQVGFGGEDTGSDPVRPDIQGAMVNESMTNRATPEAQVAAHQVQLLVSQVIATLPKNIAEVLRLREIEGLTDVETARALNMNVNTVRSNNLRGKEYLAKAFAGTETEKLFKQQGGYADPELLKRLAKFAVLAGGGAALGANYFDPQHPYKAMVQGASLALMAGQIKWGNVYKAFKGGMKYDPNITAREYLNQYDHDLARGDRLTATTRYAIDGILGGNWFKPKVAEASRIRVMQYLGGDRSIQLTPEEWNAANIASDAFSKTKDDAIHSGTLENFLDGVIYRMWKDTPERQKLLNDIQAALQKKAGQTTLSPRDQRALADKATSLSAGKARGLIPESEDVSVLVGHFIDSSTRAMANNNLLHALRNTEVEVGKPPKFVMPAGKAPSSYVAINNSQLSRYRVHPSLAPSLEFIYKAHAGNAITLAVESANTAIKRIQVALSLFHAKSLLDAFAGAGEFTHPWRNFVDAAMSAGGKSRGHEAYLSGGIGDDIDHLIRSLEITPRKGNIPVEDVTSGFYEGLKTLQDAMDSAIKYSGKITVGPIVVASKALDHLLWENVHSGLKLVVGMNALERLRRSYARDFAKDPTTVIPSVAELADRAGSYTNDVFGGLNWRRLADDAKTKWGHELGQALANPTGRRIAQVMMFAPDWTYSTVRSVVKAIGKGSGFSGLLHPRQIADLHRLYLIRSAFIYATLYNGINIAMSGHPIWENQRNGKPEPFLVDLGNGEWAQANKHAMEVPNMVMHPMKWAIGKLGNIPSEIGTQALGKEYLNPDYMPPMQGSRVVHAAKRLLPFSGTALQEQGWKEAVSSALGVPIYGHTNEQQEQLKQDRKDKSKETRKTNKEKKSQARIDSLLGGH